MQQRQAHALEIEPHNGELQLEDYRGQIISRQQQAIIQRLLSRSAEAYAASNQVGINQLQAQSFRQRCQHYCRRVIHIAPRHSDALALQSRLALDEGNTDKAKGFIKTALASAPDSALCWYSYGHIFMAELDLDMAKQCFSKTAKLDPEHFRAKASYAHVLLLQGNIAGAYSIYKKLIQIQPKDAHVRTNLFACLNQLEADQDSHLLDQELRSYMQLEDVNPADLNRLISSLLCHRYQLKDSDSSVDIAALAADGLYTEALEKLIFCDQAIEELNVAIRSYLLCNPSPAADELHLRAALASQARNNEYLWAVSLEEQQSLQHCQQELARLLEAKQLNSDEQLQVLCLWLNLVCFEANSEFELGQAKLVNILVDATGLLVNQHASAFASISQLIRSHFVQPHPRKLESKGSINNSVSQKVKQQYEVNPYPRWLNLPYQTPTSYRLALDKALPNHRLKAGTETLQVLVAGCGTGQHALQTARYFRDTFVTAIDLSDASLHYAAKMADSYGIKNIRFVKMDILELKQLEQQFDLIECSGVLHHMENPSIGALALKSVLKPGGLIKLGLYSEQARTQVVQCRSIVAKEKLGSDKNAMRALRQRLFNQPKKWQDVIASKDFFNLSGVRDLLFHEQEHRFNPGQLAQLSHELGMDFLGFVRLDANVQQQYQQAFPEDKQLNQLANWEIFEQQHPLSFAAMYQFYLQG